MRLGESWSLPSRQRTTVSAPLTRFGHRHALHAVDARLPLEPAIHVAVPADGGAGQLAAAHIVLGQLHHLPEGLPPQMVWCYGAVGCHAKRAQTLSAAKPAHRMFSWAASRYCSVPGQRLAGVQPPAPAGPVRPCAWKGAGNTRQRARLPPGPQHPPRTSSPASRRTARTCGTAPVQTGRPRRRPCRHAPAESHTREGRGGVQAPGSARRRRVWHRAQPMLRHALPVPVRAVFASSCLPARLACHIPSLSLASAGSSGNADPPRPQPRACRLRLWAAAAAGARAPSRAAAGWAAGAALLKSRRAPRQQEAKRVSWGTLPQGMCWAPALQNCWRRRCSLQPGRLQLHMSRALPLPQICTRLSCPLPCCMHCGRAPSTLAVARAAAGPTTPLLPPGPLASSSSAARSSRARRRISSPSPASSSSACSPSSCRRGGHGAGARHIGTGGT